MALRFPTFTAILQIDVSFSCVCPVIDDKFRHNIFKVAVDPQGDSRVDPQNAAIRVLEEHSKNS